MWTEDGDSTSFPQAGLDLHQRNGFFLLSFSSLFKNNHGPYDSKKKEREKTFSCRELIPVFVWSGFIPQGGLFVYVFFVKNSKAGGGVSTSWIQIFTTYCIWWKYELIPSVGVGKVSESASTRDHGSPVSGVRWFHGLNIPQVKGAHCIFLRRLIFLKLIKKNSLKLIHKNPRIYLWRDHIVFELQYQM